MPVVTSVLRVASILLIAIGLIGTLIFMWYWVTNFTKPGFGMTGYPGLVLFDHEFSANGYWMPLALLTLGGLGVAVLWTSRPSSHVPPAHPEP